jgi:hypothetical protein
MPRSGSNLAPKSLQNGIAERWVESCRRDLLDHVIALYEQYLKRLLVLAMVVVSRVT